ncbi:putative receptor like protein 25 [Salvia hispanica]|uniref:putative receptor like protein 25 n=1 Tax=Salvia hispanica TaxID=49212 RepID=UPI00200975B5|nr:putative receptor like protein 25 [Salvia hispanica]
MEHLPKLKVLVLKSNKCDGNLSLPSPMKLPFPLLQVLDISHNAFVGSLPERYFKNFREMIDAKQRDDTESSYEREDEQYLNFVDMIVTLKGKDQLLKRLLETFTAIDLSSNNFSGTIPHSIGNLTILKYLNLSHNSLIAHIPSSLGNMTDLESLDLSANKLDGEIPSELTRLTFLAKLNLSMNHLVGHIPQANQFSTFENDSYMGNWGLCGAPLTIKCNNGTWLQAEEEDGDDEYEFIDGFGWRCVVMGYGSGFVVGIGIGYMIIRSGRPKWLVEFFFGAGYRYKTKKRCDKAPPTRRGT